ncbi:serine-rich adhesin for platelets-like [Haliotis rubra]|uniref:serine-rich adhesin for platelets-like n=1 Tax=Haliotis rubra TaxID=36100 RepID=UPI001EE5DC94|nr:serine-rich adhesin for platelets-like [Haliotis rubra]
MVTFPSQLDTNGDQYTIHIVGKPGATVTIETPHHPPGGSILNLGVTGHYKGAVSRTLYYLQINLFDLQTKGVRISSDDDFAVSIIYGQDKHPASAGGYSAIPVPVLEDPSFIIVTYDQSGSSFVYFAIASSEDNITVSINVKTDDSVRFRNNDYFDGDTLELTLQKLQVLQLESKRDLTGTVIRSNGPVTVFAGIVCAAIPLGEIFCDNILEQLPSVDLWGYRYLGAPLLGRTSGTVLRAVAAYRNTTIERVSDGNIFNLQSGDVLEWEMVSEGDDIRSTKPILVVQFSKSYSVNSSGGSAMMVLRAVEYYSPKFYIIAADEFETYVNILINTADNSTLLFDGNIIAFTSEMFLEGVESLFRFAVSEGIHVIQSTNFSAVFDVVVYGYRQGQGISYQALSSIPDQTTDSGTDPLTYTTAADDSSFVVVHPESSLDTGQAIAMDTATPWPSSLSSSAADASLTTSDTIEITTTEATSPTTSSSSSSAVSASDVLVFSSAVLDTTSAVDSSSVSPSTSSPVNSDSGAESATPIGSTAISSTNALSTHESLESSGTAPSSSTASPPADGTPAADATQSPDSTASLSHPAALFLDVSYSPYNAPSLWFSSQSTTSDNLSRLVISSGTAYELELVTSPNIGSITPSSVSSETVNGGRWGILIAGVSASKHQDHF